MSSPFVGEIRMFAGNFPPRGWAYCDGQLLAVSQNDALFSLLGTIYGGDGRTTFGVPEMRGRIPIHAGTGPGLSTRRLGAKSGSEEETLTANQLASHTHRMTANTQAGQEQSPVSAVPAQSSSDVYRDNAPAPSLVALHTDAVTKLGGSQSHTNVQPSLCVHFIIALFGIYPSRT